jgi:hypothetical protein
LCFRNPQVSSEPVPSSTTATTHATGDQAARDPSGARELGGVAVAVLVVVLGVALVAAGVVWRRRTQAPIEPPDDRPPVELATVAGALSVSLDELLHGPDPRAAVVAAYGRLLEALDQVGGGRRSHEAPHEHVERVLGDLGVPAEPLHRLATLFEEARFSAHPIGEEHRRAALHALEEARAALAPPARLEPV